MHQVGLAEADAAVEEQRVEARAGGMLGDAAGAGVLVLHDVAYPGWTACVDGHPAPVLRVNLLFSGVEVGQGRHTVTFAFHPLSPVNLAAAAASLLHKDDD